MNEVPVFSKFAFKERPEENIHNFSAEEFFLLILLSLSEVIFCNSFL